MDAFPLVYVYGSDYTYIGRVVSVFYKQSGALRCVVEDDNGRLFIHNAQQLRSSETLLEQLWKAHINERT